MTGILYKVRAMKISDHKSAVTLWGKTEGMGITVSDSRSNLDKFLKRNKGFCFTALNEQGDLIGTILAGHDGKRAYIYHLAVEKSCRRSGIGRELVKRSLKKIKTAGIPKCTLFVYNKNITGKRFWQSMGWFVRKDLTMMQFFTDGK